MSFIRYIVHADLLPGGGTLDVEAGEKAETGINRRRS